jgi:hypothetical protein
VKTRTNFLLGLLLLACLATNGDDSANVIPNGDPGRLDLRASELRNPASQVHDWSDVRKFLEQSRVHEHPYVKSQFDCKHFALTLFRRAQESGIQSCLAVLNYAEKPESHCVVGFPTKDRGEVFVDFTPIVSDAKQLSCKGIVLAAPGFPLIHIPLEQIPADFTNAPATFLSYIKLQESLLETKRKLEDHSRELNVMQRRLEELQAQQTARRAPSRELKEHLMVLEEDYKRSAKEYEIRKRVYLSFVEATRSPYDFKQLPTVRGVIRL